MTQTTYIFVIVSYAGAAHMARYWSRAATESPDGTPQPRGGVNHRPHMRSVHIGDLHASAGILARV